MALGGRGYWCARALWNSATLGPGLFWGADGAHRGTCAVQAALFALGELDNTRTTLEALVP